jgi:hypothetical protein
MNSNEQLNELTIRTADNLRTVARSALLQDVSRLSLPEIDAVVEAVARVIPAGNVPGVILNGLARLPGRRPPDEVVRRDINLLFKGVAGALDKAVYGTFFAGPAAVIWGYQKLLELAGKEVDSAFPDGVWQFYVEYALREDTARHANETRGFDALLRQHQIALSPVDRLTAWVMAAVHCLHQYDDLLANEWRERAALSLLQQATAAQPDAADTRLAQQWEKQKPYGRTAETDPNHNYAAYRRWKFDRFLAEAAVHLPPAASADWRRHLEAAQDELVAYQRQLSILAYLEAGPYGETRRPLPLSQAHVGVIHQGRYYLLPICAPGATTPVDIAWVRAQLAGLPAAAPTPVAPLQPLAAMQRGALADLRRRFNRKAAAALAQLRQAPILINADLRPRHLPLAEIRQAERGVGDHPLTLFDSGESLIFDQSHIFFDGAWGAALAEIMTREALAWAVYLGQLPPRPRHTAALQPLHFAFTPAEQQTIAQSPTVTAEVGVETDALRLAPVLALRRLCKQRSDLLNLTVNDLLLLYRAIHAATYRLPPELSAELENLRREPATAVAARISLEMLQKGGAPPAILIPIDVSRAAPRERLFPLVFETPLYELNLLELHRQTVAALDQYQQEGGDRAAAYAQFDPLQRAYLATLAGFGAALSRAKEIALRGESGSVGAIKLLAHMPAPLQRLLDNIPNRFDLLNDLLKGSEVFSNVGAVAPNSSLTRFITAKDDNEKKSLAWGVLTDAEGVMRVTLRDFRPHVAALTAVAQRPLARKISQHYLDSYADGFNAYIGAVRRITGASRETRLHMPR